MIPETKQRLLTALELSAKRQRDIAQANQAAQNKLKLKEEREKAALEKWPLFLADMQTAASAINDFSTRQDITFEVVDIPAHDHFLKSAEVRLTKPLEDRRIFALVNLDPSGGIGTIFMTPQPTKADSFDMRSATVAHLERIFVSFFEQYLSDTKN